MDEITQYLYIVEAIGVSRKNYGTILLYTGITQNPVRRFHEHRAWKRYHGKPGWFEKMRRKPRRFVYLEKLGDYSKWEAQRYEKKIKARPKAKKVIMCNDWVNTNHALVLELGKKCKCGI